MTTLTPLQHRTLDALAGREAGEARKRGALMTLEARREAIVVAGRRALLQTLLVSDSATADDIRDAITLPADINPKLFGSIPGALARARIIIKAGYSTTTRAVAHARPLTIWRLRDRRAALLWLDAHPAPPPAPAPASPQVEKPSMLWEVI